MSCSCAQGIANCPHPGQEGIFPWGRLALVPGVFAFFCSTEPDQEQSQEQSELWKAKSVLGISMCHISEIHYGLTHLLCFFFCVWLVLIILHILFRKQELLGMHSCCYFL